MFTWIPTLIFSSTNNPNLIFTQIPKTTRENKFTGTDSFIKKQLFLFLMATHYEFWLIEFQFSLNEIIQMNSICFVDVCYENFLNTFFFFCDARLSLSSFSNRIDVKLDAMLIPFEYCSPTKNVHLLIACP